VADHSHHSPRKHVHFVMKRTRQQKLQTGMRPGDASASSRIRTQRGPVKLCSNVALDLGEMYLPMREPSHWIGVSMVKQRSARRPPEIFVSVSALTPLPFVSVQLITYTPFHLVLGKMWSMVNCEKNHVDPPAPASASSDLLSIPSTTSLSLACLALFFHSFSTACRA
jgi:hypothetical protein